MTSVCGMEISVEDIFFAYHPVVNFIYFVAVIGFTMFFMHPVCLGISLTAALVYMVAQRGKAGVRFVVTYMLPMLVLVLLINPAFNHAGMTILMYLPSGNPLTLESIVYGVAAACLLCAVMGWFACYTQVMTSDKFIYLFGRIIPSFSLVLSMTLGFVPRFARQFRMIRNAQRGIGCDMADGKLKDKLRHGFRIVSIMITWSLENSVETADSMKSRGYGLPGRTTFSIYRFEKRDSIVLMGILMLSAYVLVGAIRGALTFWYFPMIWGEAGGIYTWTVFIAYGMLCFLPVALLKKK